MLSLLNLVQNVSIFRPGCSMKPIFMFLLSFNPCYINLRNAGKLQEWTQQKIKSYNGHLAH